MNTPLKVIRLSKDYNGTMAVKNISFTVKQNEIIGILGPNGCGKTTTIGMLLGLLKPTDGEIRIDNMNFETNRIEILSKLPWKLRASPWEGLIVNKTYNSRTESHDWVITNENRVRVMTLVKETCLWLIGDQDWGTTEIAEYKKVWDDLVDVESSNESVDETFENLTDLQLNISQT